MNPSTYFGTLIWIGILLALVFVVLGVLGILDTLATGSGVFMSLAGSAGAYIDMKENMKDKTNG